MDVLATAPDDGTVTMTVTLAEDDHKFEVWEQDGEAVVEYQETLSWRGQIRVAEPDETVYRGLMKSDAMTDFLNTRDLPRVRRSNPQIA